MSTLKTNTLRTTGTRIADIQTAADFRDATFVVSVLINLFLFITWMALELTDAFNSQIISYLTK